MSRKYDLIVVGADMAGVTAANKCAAQGWSVAIVDALPNGFACRGSVCLACGQAVWEPRDALLQNRWATGPGDRGVDPTSATHGSVRGVDDRIRVLPSWVAVNGSQSCHGHSVPVTDGVAVQWALRSASVALSAVARCDSAPRSVGTIRQGARLGPGGDAPRRQVIGEIRRRSGRRPSPSARSCGRTRPP